MRFIVCALVLSVCVPALSAPQRFLDENLEAIASRRASLRQNGRRSNSRAAGATRRDPDQPVTPVPILKQINEHNDDGSYTYGYEAADGTFKIETRFPDGLVQGKYGYLDETTGELTVIEYGADSLGFKPGGDLPEGIVVPEVVLPDPEDVETEGRDAFDRPIKTDTKDTSRSLVVRNRARGSNVNAEPSQRRGQDVRRPIVQSERPQVEPPVAIEKELLDNNAVSFDHNVSEEDVPTQLRQPQAPRRVARPEQQPVEHTRVAPQQPSVVSQSRLNRPQAAVQSRVRPQAVAIDNSQLLRPQRPQAQRRPQPQPQRKAAPRRDSVRAAAAAAAAGVPSAARSSGDAITNFPAFTAGANRRRPAAQRSATPTRSAPQVVESDDPVTTLKSLSRSRSASRTPASRRTPSVALNSVRPSQARPVPVSSNGNKFHSFPARGEETPRPAKTRPQATEPRRAPVVQQPEPRRSPVVQAQPVRRVEQQGFEQPQEAPRPRLAPQPPRRSFAAVPAVLPAVPKVQPRVRSEQVVRPRVEQAEVRPQSTRFASDFDALVEQFSANLRSQGSSASSNREINFPSNTDTPRGSLTQSASGFRLVQHF